MFNPRPSTSGSEKSPVKVLPSEASTPSIEGLPSLPNEPHPESLQASGTAWKTLTTTVIVYITALICAFGHFFFLHHMDNRHVETDGSKYALGSQFIVKTANNLFAKTVAVGLSYVTTNALIQVNWQTLRTTPTSIGLIDDIFSLPSPISMLGFVIKFRNIRWLPTLLIASLFNLLIVVGSFAPSAFVIGPPIEVPMPSLDPADLNVQYDIGYWDTLIPKLLNVDIDEAWIVPDDCKEWCGFNVSYPAPRLSCEELPANQLSLPAYNQSLLSEDADGWDFYWATFNPTDLEIEFVKLNNLTYGNDGRPTSTPTGGPVGIYCTFSDATYDADFVYRSGSRSIKRTLVSDSNEYSQDCDWDQPQTLSDRCKSYQYTSDFLINGFSSAWVANWTWESDGIIGTYNQLDIQDLINFTNDTATKTVAITVSPANLSAAIEDLFADVALSALMRYTMDQTIPATIFADLDGSIWHFNPMLLWAIYAPAFALVLGACVYALHGVSRSGVFWDKTFSTIFITTRSQALDSVCSQDQEDMKRTLLRHDAARGQFVMINDGQLNLSPTTPRGVALTQTSAHKWARTTMIGSFVAAVVLAVGHHVMFVFLDARDSHDYPQSWIRGASNMFATLVVICLGVTTSFSLTQANWRNMCSTVQSLRTLDIFFGLPSVRAILELARGIRSIHLLNVAIIAILIQALVIVSLTAPGALEIRASPGVSESLSLPNLDFSSTLFSGVINSFDYWTHLITQIKTLNVTDIWDPPTQCKDGCSFTVNYAAPILSCRDLTDTELTLTPHNSSWDFTHDWKFYDVDDDDLLQVNKWNGDNNPSFRINYIPIVYQASDTSLDITFYGQPSGSLCHCQDGTYSTSFKLSGNRKTINTPSPSSSNKMSECAWGSINSNDGSPCSTYSSNSIGVCKAFADNLAMELGWYGDYGFSDDEVFDRLLLAQLFDYNSNSTGNGTFSFNLRAGTQNLTTAITAVFDELITGLLPKLNQTATIDATVWYGDSQFYYQPQTLWAIYGGGFAVVLAIMAYGFFCIHANNNVAMDLKFSTIMVTTRSGALDGVYWNATKYDQLMGKELKYDKRHGSFVPADRGSETSLVKK